MSDSNRVKVSVVEEVTPGTTPSNPEFEELRIKTQPIDLGFTPETIESEELDPERNVKDLILVNAAAGGGFETELSFEAWDTQLEGALFNDWVRKPNRRNDLGSTEITDVSTTTDTYTVTDTGTSFAEGMIVNAEGFTNDGNNGIKTVASGSDETSVVVNENLTDEASPPSTAKLRQVGFIGTSGDIQTGISPNRLFSSTLDFTTLNLSPGQLLNIGGEATSDKFATSEVNDFVRIESVTANAINLDVVPSGWVADNGSGKTIKVWVGDYIRNGTAKKHYTVEMQNQDHSPVTYRYFKGMVVDSLEMDIQPNQIINGAVQWQGFSTTITNTRESGATDKSPPSGNVLNASSNVGSLLENGSPVTSPNYILGATLAINNELEQQTAVGNLGAIGVAAGKCRVTGQANTYFGDKTLLEKLINNTQTSLRFLFKRTDTKIRMSFDLPQVKYSGGTTQSDDTNVTLPLDYVAYKHPTLGYTIQAQNFYYVEE